MWAKSTKVIDTNECQFERKIAALHLRLGVFWLGHYNLNVQDWLALQLKKEGRKFFHDKNQDGGILEDEKKNFGSRVSEYSCQNFFKMAIFWVDET